MKRRLYVIDFKFDGGAWNTNNQLVFDARASAQVECERRTKAYPTTKYRVVEFVERIQTRRAG